MPGISVKEETREDGRRYRVVTWPDGHITEVMIPTAEELERDAAEIRAAEEKYLQKDKRESGEAYDERHAKHNARMEEVQHGSERRLAAALEILYGEMDKMEPRCLREVVEDIRNNISAEDVGLDINVPEDKRKYDKLIYSTASSSHLIQAHASTYKDMGFRWGMSRCPECRSKMLYLYKGEYSGDYALGDTGKGYTVIVTYILDKLELLRNGREIIEPMVLQQWYEELGEVRYGLKTVSIALQWGQRNDILGAWKYMRAYSVRTKCEAPYVGYNSMEIPETERYTANRLIAIRDEEIMQKVRKYFVDVALWEVTPSHVAKIIKQITGGNGWHIVAKLRYKSLAGFKYDAGMDVFFIRK